MPEFIFQMQNLRKVVPLDPAKTVLGNVEEGVAETKALLDRYNAFSEQFAEPMEPPPGPPAEPSRSPPFAG